MILYDGKYISHSRVYRQQFMYKICRFVSASFFSNFQILIFQKFALKQFFDHFCPKLFVGIKIKYFYSISHKYYLKRVNTAKKNIVHKQTERHKTRMF